jgi:hypothetical protein
MTALGYVLRVIEIEGGQRQRTELAQALVQLLDQTSDTEVRLRLWRSATWLAGQPSTNTQTRDLLASAVTKGLGEERLREKVRAYR